MIDKQTIQRRRNSQQTLVVWWGCGDNGSTELMWLSGKYLHWMHSALDLIHRTPFPLHTLLHIYNKYWLTPPRSQKIGKLEGDFFLFNIHYILWSYKCFIRRFFKKEETNNTVSFLRISWSWTLNNVSNNISNQKVRSHVYQKSFCC